MPGESESGFHLPRGPSGEDGSALVSIRTGTNTSSECVGTLNMRLDVTLREVRQQLVSLALDAKASRKGRGSSVASAASAGARVAPATRAPLRAPPPPLTPAHMETLAKIRLHAFDFSSPFQFIKNGGVVVIPSHREDDLTVRELFPILPNTLVGEQKPAKQFCLPDEVELVGVEPPTKAGKKGPRFLRGGEDGQYVVAYAALFVRQKTKDHSEKVLMERLLMQNNVFGRLQTPQQLGTLISKYNANTKDFLGRTILQECSQEGNYYVVAFLLGHSFIKVEAADWRGQTALHLAVDRGHLEVVSLLLDAGSNVLAQDNCGRTPLHVALERGADVLAARLCARLHANGVTHDALAGYKDAQDKSPLDLFVEDSPSFIELCEAGMLPHLRTLWQHYLFDRRRVLERGVGGRTCLHVAVEARQIPVVDFLLNEVGMDAVLQDGCLDDSQRSPLHLACAQGLTAVVRHLLDLLDVNVTDCNIRTPLHHALMKKHADTAELILSRGAIDVDVMDINYCTPLHVAASHHMLRCCELLLTKHRANPALRGFSRTFACVRKPNVDVAVATVEERAEHRRARAKAERKWRMKTHEFKRRDAKTGAFMRRGQFEAEGRGSDWQESAVTLLAPRSEEDGGPDPSRKVDLKGGLMLDWNSKGSHHANSKFNDTRFSGDAFSHEHIAHEHQHWLHGHYVKDPRLGSGLFWLRKRKSELQVKPPVVEILLRRRETDDDAGFDLGADMEVTDVTPESAADRAGLAMYMGYKLAEVKTELVIKRDGGDVGLTCDGNVVTHVASGGYAEAAGVKEGMRVCAVNQRSPGEISHIPNCRDVVKTALSMAHPAKNLTLTVAVPVQGEHTVRRIPGSVYLRLQRPQLRAAPGASYELVQHTHAFASVLECAVAGRNYHATAALLLQHGAVQPNKEGAESLARIAAKLLDDRHMDLAEHVVRLMGETKGGLLHRYIGSGNHDAVRWLVEHGCSLFETHGTDELTPLALAAKTGDIRAVAYLLEHGAEDSVGEDGADPLLQAILAGKESVASLLVHLKPGRQKLLPMHVAASRGALKFGKALAGVNADLDAVTADGKTCLWVALEAAPLVEARVGRQKKGGEKKGAAAAKQTRAEEDHEEFAVFLCSRGVDLSAGGRHPLDLVDLAAAKGMWRAVDALLDLMRKSYQEGALVRVAPYPEAPVPVGADAPDQAARRLNPAAAARRDVFSYAAECGRDDVLHRLAVTWGVPPSPGRDLAAVRRNALDYAFEGAKVEPCLMLLSRGLLPTKEATSRSKEVRALYSAVYSIIRESITQQKTGRKGSEKYSAPSKPFPALPVNIFGYSTPGALLNHARVGDRVQVLEDGQWCVGTVSEDTDDGVSVTLDWGGRAVFVEPSKSDIFRDVGHTLMHEFVQHGCLAFLEKLVSYSTSSPESAHRFSASMPPSTAGCLLYTAAVHNQEQVADYLVESQRMEVCVLHNTPHESKNNCNKKQATVFEGKSPLLAALLHGNFSMVQKLVGPGRADVNRVATLHGIPHGKASALRLLLGKEVSPLFLACATLDSAAVQLLLSKQAQPGLGRVTGDLLQSPLHACVSAAPRAASPQTQKYLPKKQVAAGKSALMIATVLAKATTDLDEVAVHYAPSSATGQHVLNLAAAKGYWTVCTHPPNTNTPTPPTCPTDCQGASKARKRRQEGCCGRQFGSAQVCFARHIFPQTYRPPTQRQRLHHPAHAALRGTRRRRRSSQACRRQRALRGRGRRPLPPRGHRRRSRAAHLREGAREAPGPRHHRRPGPARAPPRRPRLPPLPRRPSLPRRHAGLAARAAHRPALRRRRPPTVARGEGCGGRRRRRRRRRPCALGGARRGDGVAPHLRLPRYRRTAVVARVRLHVPARGVPAPRRGRHREASGGGGLRRQPALHGPCAGRDHAGVDVRRAEQRRHARGAAAGAGAALRRRPLAGAVRGAVRAEDAAGAPARAAGGPQLLRGAALPGDGAPPRAAVRAGAGGREVQPAVRARVRGDAGDGAVEGSAAGVGRHGGAAARARRRPAGQLVCDAAGAAAVAGDVPPQGAGAPEEEGRRRRLRLRRRRRRRRQRGAGAQVPRPHEARDRAPR